MNINIRRAVKEDMVHILKLIEDLAKYENYPDGPKITFHDLVRDGFETDPPFFNCIIAECTKNQNILGYVLYNYAYSTWTARSIFMEDFYVIPEMRRKGIGNKLFKEICKIAKDNYCNTIDWQILKDDKGAMKFYKSHGAFDLSDEEERSCYRINRKAIDNVVNSD